MRSFHFDFGNSTRGPIDYCARIVAGSDKEAVEILKEKLWELFEGDPEHVAWSDMSKGGREYITVFFNEEAVTTRCIDDQEELRDDP